MLTTTPSATVEVGGSNARDPAVRLSLTGGAPQCLFHTAQLYNDTNYFQSRFLGEKFEAITAFSVLD